MIDMKKVDETIAVQNREWELHYKGKTKDAWSEDYLEVGRTLKFLIDLARRVQNGELVEAMGADEIIKKIESCDCGEGTHFGKPIVVYAKHVAKILCGHVPKKQDMMEEIDIVDKVCRILKRKSYPAVMGLHAIDITRFIEVSKEIASELAGHVPKHPEPKGVVITEEWLDEILPKKKGEHKTWCECLESGPGDVRDCNCGYRARNQTVKDCKEAILKAQKGEK